MTEKKFKLSSHKLRSFHMTLFHCGTILVPTCRHNEPCE